MAGPDELTQYGFNIVAESLPEKLNAIDESCPTFYKFSKSVLDEGIEDFVFGRREKSFNFISNYSLFAESASFPIN